MHLEHPAGFVDIAERYVADAVPEADGVAELRGDLLVVGHGDERASGAAALGLYETGGGEQLERLAGCGAGDIEGLAEFLLARQPLAGLPDAAGDRGAQLARDLTRRVLTGQLRGDKSVRAHFLMFPSFRNQTFTCITVA